MAAMQEVECLDDARCWFDDWSFRHQLNLLCALAHQRKFAGPEQIGVPPGAEAELGEP